MSEMKRYRKKPVVVEAIRISDDTAEELAQVEGVKPVRLGELFTGVSVNTLEGRMSGVKGDYLIRGVEGEVYPCKASVFEATYEPAE